MRTNLKRTTPRTTPLTPQPAAPSQPLPRPRPRILNTDAMVPALHRTAVMNALARMDDAAREIGAVVALYSSSDPRTRDLTNILSRVTLIQWIGDSWLAWHPAQEG